MADAGPLPILIKNKFLGGPMDGWNVVGDLPKRPEYLIAATAAYLHAYKLKETKRKIGYKLLVWEHDRVSSLDYPTDSPTENEMEEKLADIEKRNIVDTMVIGCIDREVKRAMPDYYDIIEKEVDYDKTKPCCDLGPSKLSKRTRRGQRPDDDLWGYLDNNDGRLS